MPRIRSEWNIFKRPELVRNVLTTHHLIYSERFLFSLLRAVLISLYIALLRLWYLSREKTKPQNTRYTECCLRITIKNHTHVHVQCIHWSTALLKKMSEYFKLQTKNYRRLISSNCIGPLFVLNQMVCTCNSNVPNCYTLILVIFKDFVKYTGMCINM